MTNKNIQIKDAQGNLLFPKTLGSVVLNDNNEALGGVEAGAQVNVIETVKVNGVALQVEGKAVDVTVPAAPEYTLAKKETAESGFAASYYLTKDGTKVGEYINIPKDMVVSGGELKICAKADEPVEGLAVGDPYIELTIANKDNSKIYIPVKELVDVYTQGNGITITGHSIAIDDSVVVNHTEFNTELGKKQDNLSEAQLAAANSGITSAKVSTYDGYASTIAGKQDQLSEGQLAAANSGITSAKVSKYDGYETTIAGKQAQLSDAQLAAANSGIDATKVGNYDSHIGNADIHVTKAQKESWTGKQDALTEAQLAAANSGITAAKVATYDGYATTIAGKADKATSLAGYGITDAYTKTEIDGMSLLTYSVLA